MSRTNLRKTSAIGVILLAVVLPSPVSSQDLSADEMLARMQEALYPDSFYMKATLETKRPDRRDTSMTMESYHKEGVGTFIEVLSPARSRGTRFLQKQESLWMYSPRAGGSRAIRLSPRESFQGSVFSNNDVGDPTYTDDYSATYGEDETLDHPTLGDVQCYLLIARPEHEEAAYGKVVAWMRKSDLAPVRMDLYAKSGLLFKRMTLRDFKQMAGRERASVMRMDSMVQENTYSLFTILQLEARNDLNDRMFTQARLTR
jgi:hypothetical protein